MQERSLGGILWLLALAAGATVANIYYSQPLLATIGAELHLSSRDAGLIPTVTQIGYASGMLLIVPLGDTLERRKLISGMTLISALPLFAVSRSQGLPALLLASFALGLLSVVPQLAVPFAAALAPPAERGRSLGKVMSGLLIGILLSRTVSGLAAAHLGWRTTYVCAAAVMVLLAAALFFSLPTRAPELKLGYFRLLSTLPGLLREPLLRRHALFGALGFGSFSAFWTTLAFLLASPAHHLGPDVAGLFGLVGAAGAMGAPLAGRLADARGTRAVNGSAFALIIFSFALLYFATSSLWILGIGIGLMDLGVQASHVSNQTRVLGLSEERRNRLNTIYMVGTFTGGALGSFLGGLSFATFGWPGVACLGVLYGCLGLLAFFTVAPAEAKSADAASLTA